MTPRQRRFGLRLAVVGLLTICLATLWPAPEEAVRAGATPLYCIVCGDTGGVDVFLNLLLFVPFGLGLSLAGFSQRRTTALAFILSLVVELLQMKVVAGRDASLGDLLMNTAGGGIGALIGSIWPLLVRPARPTGRRLALGYALVLWWIWAGTAWALGPSFPQGAPWFGGWAPEFGNYQEFKGKVLSVTAGGEPLLPGPALDLPRLEDAVTAHPELHVTAELGPPPAGLAPIGVIVDGERRTVLLIGQDRNDLVFGYRMRASILRLRNPLFRLHQGMVGSVGDSISAIGALRSGAVELTADKEGVRSHHRQPLNASWGWSLVAPWQVEFGGSTPILTAIWLAGLMAILGYWTVQAGGTVFAVPPLTWVVLLILVPLGAGFPGPKASEWVAAVLGTAVGMAAGRRIAGPRPSTPEVMTRPGAGPKY